MKIGIDYRLANRSHRGMARYCHEIVRELLKMDKQNDYILIIDQEPIEEFKDSSNYRYLKIRTSNFIIGEQIAITRLLFNERFDCFWSPYNTFPIIKPSKTKLFVTVHDVIFFYPIEKNISFYQRIGALYRKNILKYFYRIVDNFFTVSEFSKRELLRFLPIQTNIDVTYNCIDKFAKMVENVRDNIDIREENYFFTLSGDGPNKNLETVLQVFEKEFPNENLIVGGLNLDSKYRKRECRNIHFLPYRISDEDLIKVYLKCKCFLFFSKYEGFGLPIIEAAVCGRPILASNTTSIPEILGEYGKMILPTYENIKVIISEFIGSHTNVKTNYSQLISRFNNWERSAKIILQKIKTINNETIFS